MMTSLQDVNTNIYLIKWHQAGRYIFTAAQYLRVHYSTFPETSEIDQCSYGSIFASQLNCIEC